VVAVISRTCQCEEYGAFREQYPAAVGEQVFNFRVARMLQHFPSGDARNIFGGIFQWQQLMKVFTHGWFVNLFFHLATGNRDRIDH
jgi:hypothetical protein